MTESAAPVRVIEETPAYWRTVFDYPPFNILDATIFEGLPDLLARMDASPSLRIVVFESAIADFYLSHFDLTGKTGNITTAVGRSGLPILTDTFVRLTKSPVVSIAKIRDWANRKSASGCIPAAAAPNACPIWSAAAARLKSFSARMTSTATQRNDTDTSTGHFPTPSSTASSTRSRGASPPSTGWASPPRRILS